MSGELVNDPDRLAKRWIIMPRVLFDGLGEAIKEVVEETKVIDQETARRLWRLTVSWEVAEREAR